MLRANKILIVATALLALGVYRSALSASESSYDDIPVFGGPSSTGAELKEENAPTATGDLIKDAMPDWFATKDKIMKEHGLAYGINYSTAYQSANNSSGEDNAWGGIFQIPVSWTLMQDKTNGSSGTIVFKVEIRHKISTPLAPQDLGIQGIGAASITATQFGDKGWILTNLYWQHKMNNGNFSYVAGQIDNTDFMDMYGAINPQSAFMNLNFSTNPTIGLADQGFGIGGGGFLSDNFYLVAMVVDARADPSKPIDSAKDFFNENEYFKHIEIGYTTSKDRSYLDNIHFVYWESDRQTNSAGATSEAEGSGWTFSAAHFFQDRYLPFIRYGKSDGGGGALDEELISIGLGIYEGEYGDGFGVGLSKSTPSELTFAPGLKDQYTGEIFYR
ncbi:MAG: porin [Gammaproteobacteria bacterium]|nr:porin [Gammaproteobacteria bacterium]